MVNDSPSTAVIYTVSQLNAEARAMMEKSFQHIWISGEISNLSQPHSGHFYFSLKDALAQVKCAFFRYQARHLNFKLHNGQQVLLQAQVSLYEARGDFQLIVSQLQLTGDGALQIAFEQLKKRLYEAGWFSPEHKKPIPTFPQCIGIITSPQGAALRDILKVLHRRFPLIPIILYPTLVQGEKAAAQIVEAIQCADQRQECDVIVLARGGGSLEDLWSFNEEIVAKAIFDCHIPIVTGVGHEVDYTIADFVADLRAPTPSAAAEQISPSQIEWKKYLHSHEKQLCQRIITEWHRRYQHLQNLSQQLQHPGRRLQDQMQRLDHLEIALNKAIFGLFQKKETMLQHLEIKLTALTPTINIQQQHAFCENAKHRLIMAMEHSYYRFKQNLSALIKALDTMSPLTTLSRGYAVVMHHNRIIKKASALQKNDKIVAQLAVGKLYCHVEDIIIDKPEKKLP